MTVGVFLVAAGFVVLAGANAGLWWFRDRSQTARIAEVRHGLSKALMNAFRLSGRVSELEEENASLRERNEMLVGLVGADVEQAALHGACADEAEGWVQ